MKLNGNNFLEEIQFHLIAFLKIVKLSLKHRKVVMAKFLICILLLSSFTLANNNSYAQKIDIGSWNILNVKMNVTQQWSMFGEAQVRSLKFYNNFHYYEYKAGVNYKIHKNAVVSLGAGSYQTFKEGGNFKTPKNNDEFRIWPQVVLSQSFSKLKIEQRYRAEFRFTSNGYRNRFRYRLGVLHPFGKKKNDYFPFLVSLSNEVFFTDNEPYFERNRIQLAFNYKPSLNTTLHLGYLHQFDYKINDETGRDFLQVGLFIEFFNKKSNKQNANIEIKDN